MWLRQVWTTGSVGNNGKVAPPQPSRPTDQHKTLTPEKLKNTFNRNSGHFRRRLHVFPPCLGTFLRLLRGGSTWECPSERPRPRPLQRCCPRWRSGCACSPAPESRRRSEDLKHTQQPHVEHKLRVGGAARRGRIPSALTFAAVALRALLGGAAPLRAAAAGAARAGLAG